VPRNFHRGLLLYNPDLISTKAFKTASSSSRTVPRECKRFDKCIVFLPDPTQERAQT
jgi:hypothetical protein